MNVRLLHAGAQKIKSLRSALSSVRMSLRYADLAPVQRREAVAKLLEKPLLALTLRLQLTVIFEALFCRLNFSSVR